MERERKGGEEGEKRWRGRRKEGEKRWRGRRKEGERKIISNFCLKSYFLIGLPVVVLSEIWPVMTVNPRIQSTPHVSMSVCSIVPRLSHLN